VGAVCGVGVQTEMFFRGFSEAAQKRVRAALLMVRGPQRG
jgi:hypothetical protein